jgi:hypothetical protein
MDVATRANVEAQFTVPPHQSGLNQIVLANVPGYLGFKVHNQIKTVIISVAMY